MLCKEVSTHLIRTALLHCELLLDKHPVADEVISGKDVFRARVIARVVLDVNGRLTVHEKSNGLFDGRFASDFQLQPP